MPFVLILVGLVFLVSLLRGTQDQLFATLESDLTGGNMVSGALNGTGGGTIGSANSFVPWVAAIGAIGAIGYIKPLRPLSHIFLVLVVLVLFLANKGFFASFKNQVLGAAAPLNSTIASGSPLLTGASANPAAVFGQYGTGF